MSWWDNKVDLKGFKMWVKGKNAPSRKRVREYIYSRDNLSVLDVGAGLCEDYIGYIELGGKIHYEAIDFTDSFVKHAQDNYIHMTKANSEEIPFGDKTFDVVYCRHLLEHLEYYEKTINEMIRVGKKEVIITFFFPPTKEPDEIRLVDNLNHNRYNIEKLNRFIWSHNRVWDVTWEYFSEDESIVYIQLAP